MDDDDDGDDDGGGGGGVLVTLRFLVVTSVGTTSFVGVVVDDRGIMLFHSLAAVVVFSSIFSTEDVS